MREGGRECGRQGGREGGREGGRGCLVWERVGESVTSERVGERA